jgi:hypothetical protein
MDNGNNFRCPFFIPIQRVYCGTHIPAYPLNAFTDTFFLKTSLDIFSV